MLVRVWAYNLPLNIKLIRLYVTVGFIATDYALFNLDLQRTTVLLQRSLRESSWPSPYLDAFGEEVKRIVKIEP